MKHLLLIMTLTIFCCSFVHCTGNECSATHTKLDDPDSDCVLEGDNCPSVYNPNQEDSDEDEFGDACEAIQCVNDSACVGVLYQTHATYNLRGLYESSSPPTNSICDTMNILSLTQQSDKITVTNNLDQIFIGTVFQTEDNSNQVFSAFQNTTNYCQMSFSTEDFFYTLKCYDKTTKNFCETSGKRNIVELGEP